MVLRAGYGICLYQFLIIAYLFTLHLPAQLQGQARPCNFAFSKHRYYIIEAANNKGAGETARTRLCFSHMT